MRFIIICIGIMQIFFMYAKNDESEKNRVINQKLSHIEEQHPAIYNYLCLMLVENATIYIGANPAVLQEKEIINAENILQNGVIKALEEQLKLKPMYDLSHQ